MTFDELVRGADPAGADPDRVDLTLLHRVLEHGPAPRANRTALLAAVVAAAVMLSVVVGLGRARDDAPAPVGTPTPAAPTRAAAPSPVDCGRLLRGWTPTYLPRGFVVDGKEMAQGSSRQQQYARRSAEQPTTTTWLTVARICTDPPTPLPTGAALPTVTLRGHPAQVQDYGDLVRIDWQEAPGLVLSLMTATDPGDTLLSVPELVRVANGLRQQATDPEPPPAACPGLTSYRARTLPPGYRLGTIRPGGPEGQTVTYVKGPVTIAVVLGCHVVIGDDQTRSWERVTVHGKPGSLTRPGVKPVQVTWQEGPNEFWVTVGAELANQPQPTRAEVLTVAEGLRR